MNINKKQRLLKEFKKLVDNPEFFARLGHEFQGGKQNNNIVIWTGAEDWAFKDYLDEMEYEYPLADIDYKPEGHERFTDWLKKNKLSFEWYDSGTIMIYEEGK